MKNRIDIKYEVIEVELHRIRKRGIMESFQ